MLREQGSGGSFVRAATKDCVKYATHTNPASSLPPAAHMHATHGMHALLPHPPMTGRTARHTSRNGSVWMNPSDDLTAGIFDAASLSAD